MWNVKSRKWPVERTRTRSSSSNNIVEEIKPSSGWTENLECHYLLINLPEFKQDEIKIQVEGADQVVKISGERKVGENKTIHFSSTYRAPDNTDIQRTSGKLEAGTLTVTFPKLPPPPPPPQSFEETVTVPEQAAPPQLVEEPVTVPERPPLVEKPVPAPEPPAPPPLVEKPSKVQEPAAAPLPPPPPLVEKPISVPELAPPPTLVKESVPPSLVEEPKTASKRAEPPPLVEEPIRERPEKEAADEELDANLLPDVQDGDLKKESERTEENITDQQQQQSGKTAGEEQREISSQSNKFCSAGSTINKNKGVIFMSLIAFCLGVLVGKNRLGTMQKL